MTKFLNTLLRKLCIGLFVITLIIFTLASWEDFQTTTGNLNWQEVPGEVLSSAYVTIPGDPESETFSARTLYAPVVHYQYEVDGQMYESDRIRATSLRYCGESYGKKFVSEYEAGTQITVYYPVGDPERAILQPQRDLDPFELIDLVARWIFILVLMISAAVLYSRSHKRYIISGTNTFVSLISRYILTGFLGLACLFATAEMIAVSIGYYLAHDTENWPSVQGTVTTSYVEQRDQNQSRRHQFLYTYQVGDTQYMGNRITLLPLDEDERPSAEVRIYEYPIGREVYVFHHPAFPSLAVLVPGQACLAVDLFLDASFGILWSTLGLVILRLNNQRIVRSSEEVTKPLPVPETI